MLPAVTVGEKRRAYPNAEEIQTMSRGLDRIAVHRRGLLIAAGAGAVALALPSLGRAEGSLPPSEAFQAAFKAIAGDAMPEETLVTLELPEQAENGNIVPYKLLVESPMTETDYVRKLHLLSTANPNAKVATFQFTPACGKAAVTGRMRLAKTQDVVAIAELSNGKLVMGTTRVEVTLGGCLN